jgi:hypothetical protein
VLREQSPEIGRRAMNYVPNVGPVLNELRVGEMLGGAIGGISRSLSP